MAPSLPAAQIEQLDFSETVNVVVGKGEFQQHFILHKNIICRRSKFFRAAFSGNFLEAKEKVVTLPEIDTNTFKIWLQWAYSGDVVLLSAREQVLETEKSIIAKRRCGELYVLADVLEDTLCRNAATDLLRDKLLRNFGPCTALFEIVYGCTPESSKLRMLCRDWRLANPLGTQLSDSRDSLPVALYQDLAIEWAKANLDKSKFIKPRHAPKCKYHDHDEEVPACEEHQSKS